jgi:nitrogen regulatory protein P-II 2
VTVALKLITVVAEEVIAPKIAEDMARLGASGYTMSEAHGQGSRGKRMGRVGEVNMRIEAVVSAAVADAILERLAAHYFQRYATIAWVCDVAVMRGEKYV